MHRLAKDLGKLKFGDRGQEMTVPERFAGHATLQGRLAAAITDKQQLDIVAIEALKLGSNIQHRIQPIGKAMGSCERRYKGA